MAHRLATARGAGDLAGHHIIAQQRDDAMQRAHPFDALGGERRRAPAHRFWPGKGADDGRDGGGEHIGGRSPRLVDDGEQHPVALDELLAGEAGLAQEAFERLGRGARLGALDLLRHRRRLQRQIARDKRQAARRGVGGDDGCGQADGGELGGEEPRQILPCAGLHAGGDFFRAKLQQIIAHADTATSDKAQPLRAFTAVFARFA